MYLFDYFHSLFGVVFLNLIFRNIRTFIHTNGRVKNGEGNMEMDIGFFPG